MMTCVINGSVPYGFELSKATQADALATLGLPFPRSVVINDASQAVGAATGLRYPVLVKANVGGSGAGIVRYDKLNVPAPIALGVDSTGESATTR